MIKNKTIFTIIQSEPQSDLDVRLWFSRFFWTCSTHKYKYCFTEVPSTLNERVLHYFRTSMPRMKPEI